MRVRGQISNAGHWALWLTGYVVVLAVTGIVIASATKTLAMVWLQADRVPTDVRVLVSPAPVTRLVRSAVMVPTQDDWADKLRDPAFWAKNRSGGNKPAAWTKPVSEAPRSNLGGPLAAPSASARRSVEKPSVSEESEDETFRTMCVRPCDGAFFPVSFSTTRDSFDADAASCDKRCPGARLFYYRNPGAELEDMEDLKGHAYKKLPTAFLFRTTYNAQCKCRAHPWEDASHTQHRLYALEAQSAKGSKIAASELTALKGRIKQAELDAAAEKKRADAARVVAQKKLAEDAKAAKANARLAALTGTSAAIKGSASAAAGNVSSTANLWGPKPGQITATTSPLAPQSVVPMSIAPSSAAPSSAALSMTARPMRLGAPLGAKSTPQSKAPQVC